MAPPTRRSRGRPRRTTSCPPPVREESPSWQQPSWCVAKWQGQVDVAGCAVRGGAESLEDPGDQSTCGVLHTLRRGRPKPTGLKRMPLVGMR